MIPWPIAVLSTWFGILAACAAFNALTTSLIGVAVWSWLWCGVAFLTTITLATMRVWARRMAVGVAVFFMAGALLAALGTAMLAQHPLRILVSTAMAGVHLIVARYLTRPRVKAWFET